MPDVVTLLQSANHLLSVLISYSSPSAPFFITPRWHWRAAKQAQPECLPFVLSENGFTVSTLHVAGFLLLSLCLTMFYQLWMEASFSPIVCFESGLMRGSPTSTNRPQAMSCFSMHLPSHSACCVSCLWAKETHVVDENLIAVRVCCCFSFCWSNLQTHFLVLHRFFWG